MIGKIVGNYKIIQALGEGGVGMVYKGVDTMLDREVAIKVLRPELSSQTSIVERFRSEAVTLAKLSHPNIATLYSLFRQGDDLFMVLEFISGVTLDQMLRRHGTIPTDEAIPIFCQALEGINYAHERGIVHRDIKPGNMMITENGILKVLDFGIARLLGSNRMTRVGNVIGTLEYMSPEQVKGLDTDARSDVYGLGIMLYEILTGRLPFESENDFELMKMQTEEMPLAPTLINPDISQEVEAAILKAVAKDPGERFQSAGDFLERFFQIGFSLPTTTFYASALNLRKSSRPSNPGLSSGETKQEIAEIPVLQSRIATEPIIAIPKSAVPVTLEVAEELKKEAINQARLAKTENEPTVPAEIKGTRLAPAIVTNPNEIKATRLGVAQTEEVSLANPQKSTAFFDKLTWIHYAGAGAIALFFMGLVSLAAIIPFILGGSEVTTDPGNLERAKNVNSKKNETVANPTREPVAQTPSAASPSTSSTPYQPSHPELIQNPPTETPDNPSSQNPPKDRETVKTNPPSQQPPQPKKAPAAPKTKSGKAPDLIETLTNKRSRSGRTDN